MLAQLHVTVIASGYYCSLWNFLSQSWSQCRVLAANSQPLMCPTSFAFCASSYCPTVGDYYQPLPMSFFLQQGAMSTIIWFIVTYVGGSKVPPVHLIMYYTNRAVWMITNRQYHAYSTVGNVFMFEYDDRHMVHFCTNTIFPELHANTIQCIVQITKAEIGLIEQVERHLVHAKDLLKSC